MCSLKRKRRYAAGLSELCEMERAAVNDANSVSGVYNRSPVHGELRIRSRRTKVRPDAIHVRATDGSSTQLLE